jgi:fructosamine-3-kinase
LQAELRAALATALGSPPSHARPLSGGDICAAWRVTLDRGEEVFVKHHPRPPPGLFTAEASGLRWLSSLGPLPTPAIRAVAETFLVLDYIAPGTEPVDPEQLGQGLAALHRNTRPCFGLASDNFLGRLHQRNTPSDDAVSFYRECRFAPLIAQSRPEGRMRRRLSALLDTLPERIDPLAAPSPLHGDLWSGNLLVGSGGQPWLIDPAVSAGHREQDLAMMRLFGGFSERTFDAYGEAWPLSPGWAVRVPLWQLYYLLAHVCLFGDRWWGSVDGALRELGH